ncbi:MAG TPA: hypothetical protein VFQ44_16045 [Streptosporangiaceae bacterium]|nr:hypothetical protein [Streptosporangiaceae bacterium]
MEYVQDAQRPRFIIEPQLVGRDSYLSGQLTAGGIDFKVRIYTLDNRTVLVPSEQVDAEQFGAGSRLDGLLRLRCSPDAPPLPADLSEALCARKADLACVDPREQAYLLAFLAEAREPSIRQGRIAMICDSLEVVRSP